MGRAGLADGFIHGGSAAVLLEELLQRALAVLHGAADVLRFGPAAQDNLACLLQIAVQIHRGQNGFHGVAQHAGLLAAAGQGLALVHQQRFAHAQPGRHLAQCRFAHQQRPQVGQLALLMLRVGSVKIIAHDILQHRVAQELQTLVVLLAHGGVRQGLTQKGRVLELILQSLHQILHGTSPLQKRTNRRMQRVQPLVESFRESCYDKHAGPLPTEGARVNRVKRGEAPPYWFFSM